MGTQFTTTTSSSASASSGVGITSMGSGSSRPPIPSSSNNSSFRPAANVPPFSSSSSSSDERRQDRGGGGGGMATENDMDDDDDYPSNGPTTPAVQHYYHSSSSAAATTAAAAAGGSSSTSSSKPYFKPANSILKSSSFDLSSVSAPHFVQQQHPTSAFHHQPGFLPSVTKPPSNAAAIANMENGSPISPAMMIGGDHEPLLLPPPEQKARQEHLEWLRQLNERAAQAAASYGAPAPTTSTNSTPHHGMPHHQQPHHHTTQQQQPVPHPQQQQAATLPGFPAGVTLHPTAAAALASGNPLFFTHAAAFLRQRASSPVETEEKRAKRLERNRESARKSRRRKKERLSNLEEKVNKLHGLIEAERRVQIGFMEDVLVDYGKERILQLKEDYVTQEGDVYRDERLGNELGYLLIEMMEPPIRKEIIEFQYTTLNQYMLPRYQKFLLWLALHPESYFLAGKEEHAKREAEQDLPRPTSGKVSSKQIGDELTNGRKLSDGRFIPPPPVPTYSHLIQHSDTVEPQSNSIAHAPDAARMWPLTCFELSISVDQEERFLQALKRYVRSNFLHVITIHYIVYVFLYS